MVNGGRYGRDGLDGYRAASIAMALRFQGDEEEEFAVGRYSGSSNTG
jgi:hypothetical protein